MIRFLLDDGPRALRLLADPDGGVRWTVAEFPAGGSPAAEARRAAYALTCHRALSAAHARSDPPGTTHAMLRALAAQGSWDDPGVILRLARYLDARGLSADAAAFLADVGAHEDPAHATPAPLDPSTSPEPCP